MKITLSEQYFAKENFNQYIITRGMDTRQILNVNKRIGDLVLVSGRELAQYAKEENKHLAEGIGSNSDYPFLAGEYEIVTPESLGRRAIAFWNKLKRSRCVG